MASFDERGFEGHLSIDKERVWDLKTGDRHPFVFLVRDEDGGVGICC